VTVEITPEPTPEEREALQRALAAEGSGAAADRPSAWWRAGVVEAEPEEC
jgi:hypothetical protein